jgi:hypothetical protein
VTCFSLESLVAGGSSLIGKRWISPAVAVVARGCERATLVCALLTVFSREEGEEGRWMRYCRVRLVLDNAHARCWHSRQRFVLDFHAPLACMMSAAALLVSRPCTCSRCCSTSTVGALHGHLVVLLLAFQCDSLILEQQGRALSSSSRWSMPFNRPFIVRCEVAALSSYVISSVTCKRRLDTKR